MSRPPMPRRALFACLFFAAAPAHAELVDRIAAVVNNEIIPLTEVEQRGAPELALASRERDPAQRATRRAEVLKQALDQLIGERLVDGQVKELSIDVTEGEVDLGIEDVRKQNNIDAEQFEKLLTNEGYTLASYRVFMKKQLAKLKIINLKVRSKVKVSDEDVKAEYARYARAEESEAEVHARHILVQVPAKAPEAQVEEARQKALKLAEEAKKPGVDFAELAKKVSEGPSAADGGDLGFFRRGVMVAEFEKAAFTLPQGGVSEPVRTKFGWHVLKVEERRSIPPKSFDELKDALRERLGRAQLEKLTEQYVRELRDAASVEVKLP